MKEHSAWLLLYQGYKGLGMNGFIATWYAKNTQKNMAAYACRVILSASEGSHTVGY